MSRFFWFTVLVVNKSFSFLLGILLGFIDLWEEQPSCART